MRCIQTVRVCLYCTRASAYGVVCYLFRLVRCCVCVCRSAAIATRSRFMVDSKKALPLFVSKVFFFLFTYKVFGLLHASL